MSNTTSRAGIRRPITRRTGASRWIVGRMFAIISISCLLYLFCLVAFKSNYYNNVILGSSNLSRGGGNIANADHESINVAKDKQLTEEVQVTPPGIYFSETEYDEKIMDGDENSPKKGAQKGNMLLQLMDMDMSCS